MNTQYCLFFFFFQAEDGIRDKLVTGVQTCALPICTNANSPSRPGAIPALCWMYVGEKYVAAASKSLRLKSASNASRTSVLFLASCSRSLAIAPSVEATSLPLASLPAHQCHHESRSMRSRWTKAATSLHLGETAIHEQLGSRDIAAVVGGEKHHGFRDLVGRTAPAERHRAGDRLGALLARFRGTQDLIQSGRIGRAPDDRVDANVAGLQSPRARPGEVNAG